MKEFIEFNATKLKSKSEIASLLNHKFGTSFENKQSYYLIEKIKSQTMGPLNEDAQNLIKNLQNRTRIYFDYKINEKKHLSHLIYASEDMITKINCYSDLVLFDITHQITRYDLNLALFIAIDNEGRSVVVFYGLILSLKNENIEWLFQKVKAAFEFYKLPLPKVIMSDDGKTVTPNIARFFPTSKNQLCAWHISQNFSKKIRNPKIKSLASILPYEADIDRTNHLIKQILENPNISAKDLNYFSKKISHCFELVSRFSE
jgi:hypothetical protein